MPLAATLRKKPECAAREASRIESKGLAPPFTPPDESATLAHSWLLHRGSVRVSACTAVLASMHVALLVALSAEDTRSGPPGRQLAKECCISVASLVAALHGALWAASIEEAPPEWWLKHGATALAALLSLASLALPALLLPLLSPQLRGLRAVAVFCAAPLLAFAQGLLHDLRAAPVLQRVVDCLSVVLAMTVAWSSHPLSAAASTMAALLCGAAGRRAAAHAGAYVQPSVAELHVWRDAMFDLHASEALFLSQCKV